MHLITFQDTWLKEMATEAFPLFLLQKPLQRLRKQSEENQDHLSSVQAQKRPGEIIHCY